MNKIKKITQVLNRKMIQNLNYFSSKKYMVHYRKYLINLGIKMGGVGPNYIDPSAHFDGQGYDMISIGEHTVISREVLVLVHDYSIFRALNFVNKEEIGHRILKPVIIGNNCFIGARSTLLPGTVIGDNVIVGAGAVVKGKIPNNVVIAGNPAKIIETTKEYAEKWLLQNQEDG